MCYLVANNYKPTQGRQVAGVTASLALIIAGVYEGKIKVFFWYARSALNYRIRKLYFKI